VKKAVAGALLAVLLGAYFWLGYSPAPAMPTLGGTFRDETLGERAYHSYVPKDLPTNAPLVLVLHGSEQDAAGVRKFTGYAFDELADQKRFALVYPEGHKRGWNDCRKHSVVAASRENIDDVGFLKALVAHMHDAYGTSATGVFVFGYSNGGQMAYRLALEAPELIGAIATASSNLPVPDNMRCTLKGPTPRAMLSAGTADPIVPFNGGEATIFGFASRGFVVSANETADTFARLNGLEAPARATLEHLNMDDPTSITSRTWWRDGKRYVVQYVVQNGGHVVPQSRFRFPRLLGKTSRDLELPRTAVEFFLSP
jgi:polyhydroxybutyrate depolymerase